MRGFIPKPLYSATAAFIKRLEIGWSRKKIRNLGWAGSAVVVLGPAFLLCGYCCGYCVILMSTGLDAHRLPNQGDQTVLDAL